MAYINITKDNFDELVVKSPKKVLLDFWATWCVSSLCPCIPRR